MKLVTKNDNIKVSHGQTVQASMDMGGPLGNGTVVLQGFDLSLKDGYNVRDFTIQVTPKGIDGTKINYEVFYNFKAGNGSHYGSAIIYVTGIGDIVS